jgi:hypothetical protein
MLSRTLLTLSVSVILGTAVVAPNAVLAQIGPPPGPPPGFSGPPPGLGAGGPPPGGPPAAPAFAGLPPRGPSGAPPRDIAGAPPHFSRLDGTVGPHGLDRGGPAKFRGVEGRAAAYSADGYARNSYTNYGYGRGYRHAYAATATAAYAYARADASSDDGCYYISAYRRYGTRRVLVCHED